MKINGFSSAFIVKLSFGVSPKKEDFCEITTEMSLSWTTEKSLVTTYVSFVKHFTQNVMLYPSWTSVFATNDNGEL